MKKQNDLNDFVKKFAQDSYIKEIEESNKELYRENGFLTFALFFLFIAGVLISIFGNADYTKYYYIAPNTQIAEMTKSEIIEYCYYDDGLDGLSFKGKYDNQPALVNIYLDYVEYDTLNGGTTLYELTIYANSTVKVDGSYNLYSEKVDVIYTTHY